MQDGGIRVRDRVIVYEMGIRVQAGVFVCEMEKSYSESENDLKALQNESISSFTDFGERICILPPEANTHA